jgi:HD-GYP domain-containing protein (c-di-GMP phosphodiesterase class II)
MSETRVLLGKIAALKQRLDQVQGLANEARSVAAALVEEPEAAGLTALHQRLTEDGAHDLHLDHVVRPVVEKADVARATALPRQLAFRARRVLERGRSLIAQLRDLAEWFAPTAEDSVAPSRLAPTDPLAILYRQTTVLADTTLRMIPLFPDSTTAQLHLAEGVEIILTEVAARVQQLQAGVKQCRQEQQRLARLMTLLTALEAGQALRVAPFLELVEDLLAEAHACAPLRFTAGDPRRPAHFTAAHQLTVARIIARIVRHDPQLRGRTHDAVLAALVYDIGMLRVPAALLTQTAPVNDEQRRIIEAHCQAGLVLAAPLLLEAPWLSDAILSHHERLDGTGYPSGLRDHLIGPLARLLAVADVYASLCTPRSHRPSRETRTALTDTLLLAEQGLLDRQCAECLLQLSFYPTGSVVELADGSVAVVVATPTLRRDLNSPARPVVKVLLDPQGGLVPLPTYLDLAQCETPSIVRTLSPRESRDLLGPLLPEWLLP